MTDRIIDLSDTGARLSVRHAQLVIERNESAAVSVPLEEICTLIASNRAVVYSNAVLAGLMEHGAVFVCCDERCMPVGWMLPVANHHLQGERFDQQVSSGEPVNKRIWQQIVRAKIRAQSALLLHLRGDDAGLAAMVERVQSGDPMNVEAQAARRYWPLVFGDAEFRRNRDANDQNRFLNYGYAVVRAVVARAICAAGLHPSIGLHHENRYDAFPLADDLMEPFRPLVDHAVAVLIKSTPKDAPLDRKSKAFLIESVLGPFLIEDELRGLFDIASRMAVSLVKVYAGSAKKLSLPELAYGSVRV